ncbi:MAG: carbon-nitrogen family hydrolase [Deltaproteobacteria bacterium]|nr:carbon-nitrogen family hydrolase [Deltaproteobacteria bacterium]MBW2075512.1 carbon-nitrogen family hydrolase [Deltaproteobacteria bacterium]RLB80405.1 MAG: carbon-nitrogen family hydrolase [Deltaproteobacteria bacterium]
MKLIKAGIIQFDIRRGDIESNLAGVKNRITTLAKQGIRLILLPEMWSTGFANKRLKELSDTTPRVLEDVCRVAKKRCLTIIGSLPEKGAKGIYNTAYVVDRNGSIAGIYRKIHLFSPTREDHYFEPGRQAVVSETSLGPIGLMICYDLRFPELCRSLALRGAKMVAVMAEWPAERLVHWEVLLRARAIENQLFILGANRCGQDDNLVYAGHSRIISPEGKVLARAGKRPAIISDTIDLSLIDKIRKQIPCLKERIPEAYV